MATDESHELDVDELLARAAASDAAAAAVLAPTTGEAGTQRRRQRFAHRAQVYRRLVEVPILTNTPSCMGAGLTRVEEFRGSVTDSTSSRSYRGGRWCTMPGVVTL